MITYKTGDLLSEDAEALVNTVNCVGVMGRGVALRFKRVYPDNFKAYAEECGEGRLKPGLVFVYETALLSPRFIVNFPTKNHWRAKSRLRYIETGLQSLVAEIKKRDIRSIAIPALGCGEGGLNWQDVRNLMETAFAELEVVDIVIFEPSHVPAGAAGRRSFDIPEMTPARAVLVSLMHQYRSALLDPMITLLELHKLAYFSQEAGEDLKLEFAKAPHGPYADNLGCLLRGIEGRMIVGYEGGGDAPHKELELVAGAVEDAAACMAASPETQQRCRKVADLVDGFESPFGLELLSTAHWVASRENPEGFDDLVSKAYAWNSSKKQFSERQFKIAVEALQTKRWIEPLGNSSL